MKKFKFILIMCSVLSLSVCLLTGCTNNEVKEEKQEEKTVEPKQKKVQPKKVVEEFIEQVPATEPQTQQADFELIDETNNEDEIFPEESLVEEEQPSDNKDEEPARPLTPKEELLERMKKNRMK